MKGMDKFLIIKNGDRFHQNHGIYQNKRNMMKYWAIIPKLKVQANYTTNLRPKP